ncbi:MAG: hypothetical protein SFV32_07300 [Opitutaceae bacterium]|nr:hypothetical protein [Opitutaceae bacterium]
MRAKLGSGSSRPDHMNSNKSNSSHKTDLEVASAVIANDKGRAFRLLGWFREITGSPLVPCTPENLVNLRLSISSDIPPFNVREAHLLLEAFNGVLLSPIISESLTAWLASEFRFYLTGMIDADSETLSNLPSGVTCSAEELRDLHTASEERIAASKALLEKLSSLTNKQALSILVAFTFWWQHRELSGSPRFDYFGL